MIEHTEWNGADPALASDAELRAELTTIEWDFAHFLHQMAAIRAEIRRRESRGNVIPLRFNRRRGLAQ